MVSDQDLLRGALLEDSSLNAIGIAGEAPLIVEADDDLAAVSAALAERGRSHTVVAEGGVPVGIVSTLDIAKALAK